MKIILCALNAKYIHTNIAIRFIKEYCSGRINSEIVLKEYTINNYIDDIVQDLFTQKPDIIAFSCYIWNIEMIRKISTIIRIILPDIKIIYGGPEVTYNATEILEKSSVCDIIIRGEGEVTSSELYSALENNESISEIYGITYKNSDGTVISTENRMPMDLKDVPFPYTDFDEIKNRICYYEASRGCPFRCQYCLSSVESGVRFAPIEKVKSELSVFLSHNVRQVKFVDRTFNAKNTFALDIIKFIIENDNGITNFHFEIAADILTEDLLDLLRSARKELFQLEIGVQSTNRDTLDAISRNGDFKKISSVVEKVKSGGNIHIHLDLIAGLPYEGIDSFIRSYNDVYSLKPHQLQLGFLKVLHGSGMEKMCADYGIEYSPFAPYEVLRTHSLSYDDILYLKKIEDLTEIYYNSNRFIHAVDYLVDHSENAFDMFSKLSLCRSKVFTENISHNKNDTYKFLIDALGEFENTDHELFRWILKFDLILHEKPKGTPDWTIPVINMLSKDDVYRMTVKEQIIQNIFPMLSDYPPKELINYTHIEKMPVNPVTLEKKETMVYVNYLAKDMWGNAEVIVEQGNYM